MIEITRILVPVDFSDYSRHALDHAAAIARWYGASLTALHVVPPVTSLLPMGDAALSPPFVFAPENLQQFERALATFVAPATDGVPVESVVAEGSITGTIVQVARDLPADLIVMGTHGRSGFDRLMLGSTTEKMLRKAPGPMLTVPLRAAGAAPAGAVPFTRILCAIDFSPSAMRALAFAESLARESDAALTVLHVLEPVSVFEPVVMGGSGAPPVDADARSAARGRLREIVAGDTRIYSHVAEVVACGKAYREILREATERRSDLIVIGAHGGRLGLAAFGSTANHVVRAAVCPVLTLRA